MGTKPKIVETKEKIAASMSKKALQKYIDECEGRGAKCEVVKEGSKKFLICRYKKKSRKKATA